MNSKWDQRFLGLARFWAETCSKDPSTKVCAVIADGKRVVSLGYNGFPAGVDDDPEAYNDREEKYARIVHADANAIVNARQSVADMTMYVWPFSPCSSCAKLIIQSGIKRVVIPEQAENDRDKRWASDFQLTKDLFDQAEVELCYA